MFHTVDPTRDRIFQAASHATMRNATREGRYSHPRTCPQRRHKALFPAECPGYDKHADDRYASQHGHLGQEIPPSLPEPQAS